jgi:ABC-2 type transport system permease protein
MSISSETATAYEPNTARQAAPSPTRPFYWSVRRELWEHRAIYIAPLVVAGLILLGFVIRILHFPQMVRTAVALPPMEQNLYFAAPLAIASASIALTGLIVAFFYCLGALYNERRDRSILFWKSLPVSNVTTVLSKAFVPFVALPAVIFAVALATQLVMLLLGSAVLAANGVSPATLWNHWPMFKTTVVLLYGLVVMTLWYAPIYGWLLLVSSWARSMAILWAVLPPLGLCIAERIAADSSYFASLLDYRVNGYLSEAFHYTKGTNPLDDPFMLMTPARFAGTPGLWIGLVVGVAFLAGAIWLRRNREPI